MQRAKHQQELGPGLFQQKQDHGPPSNPLHWTSATTGSSPAHEHTHCGDTGAPHAHGHCFRTGGAPALNPAPPGPCPIPPGRRALPTLCPPPRPYLVCHGGKQQVARLGVHEPLGLPRAPRGVQQEEHVLAAHALWGTHGFLLGHGLKRETKTAPPRAVSLPSTQRP